MATGTRSGTYPPETDALRVIRAEIPGRSGLLLGMRYLGLDPLRPTTGDEAEALSLGARLATSAITVEPILTDDARTSSSARVPNIDRDQY